MSTTTTALPTLNFPSGIPGFPGRHEFMLEGLDPLGALFDLHCPDDPSVRLLLVPPGVFFPDYLPELDQSSIDLVLKVNVRPGDTFNAIRARTEKFVADTPLSGRVEGVIGDSQFLGLSEPKKQRDALVKAIADDAKMMQGSFAGSASPVTVSITGMEQRVQTRPAGPLDLEVFIPYQMSLKAGAAPS